MSKILNLIVFLGIVISINADVTVRNRTTSNFKLSLMLDVLKDDEKTVKAGDYVIFSDSKVFPLKKANGLKIFTDEKKKEKIKEIRWTKTGVLQGKIHIEILSYNPETKEIITTLDKQ